MSICYACNKEIYNEVTNALSRTYHPHCFVCAKCQFPIREPKFSKDQGLPYHQKCYIELRNFRCSNCGELLLDQYVEKDEKPYCEGCYKKLFLPQCSICKKPIIGEYITNDWEDSYCKEHELMVDLCSSCGRPACRTVTNGKVRYDDGRIMCAVCRQTAVDNLKEAWPAFNKVKRSMTKWGIDIVKEQFPINLVNRDRIKELSTNFIFKDTCGVTSTTTLTQNGVQIDRKINAISILYGLPLEHFMAVAAHEIGHAWLHTQGIRILLPMVEEGFCELLSYLWLNTLDTETAKIRMQRIVNNDDQVYGVGFRMALSSYSKSSFSDFLAYFKSHANFP